MVPQSADRPRVFISHCTEADRDEAVRAAQLLESSGLRAWIAPRDIRDGEDHAEAIARAIPECAALLLVLSGPALDSPHVAIEAELALSARVPIVPVVLPSFPGFTGLADAWRYRLTKTQVRTDSDLERVVQRCLDIALPKPARPRPPKRGAAAPGRTYQVSTPERPQFVGADRRGHLQQILEVWEGVNRMRQPHLAVLLGETGFGKTRIVQEFYSALAAAQPEPAFWPADIAAVGDRAVLRETRKRITPAVLEPPPGSAAGYLWAGYLVDEGYQGRLDLGPTVLADELARCMSVAATLSPSGAAADMVRGAGVDPGLGTASLHQAVAELLHRGTGQGADAVAPGTTEAFWQGVIGLWEAEDSLPAVVVIEDGHYAGVGTVALLEQLLQREGLPLLIVVCAQPSQLSRGAGAERIKRPLAGLLRADAPSVTAISVERLADRDIAEVFLEVLPDLDADTLQAAVRKVDGNPYHARMLVVEMARVAGRGVLGEAWIEQRPSDFDGELRLQWGALDGEVRRLLSGIAVLGTQVPERLGFKALRTVDPHCDSSLAPSLESGWLRRLQTDDALRFLERARWAIAHEESYDEWAAEDRHRIVAEALGTLESLAGGASGVTDPLLQQLHLALAHAADEAGVPFDRAAAIRSGLAASLRLRLANDDQGALEIAQQADRLVVGHEDADGLDILAVEGALAMYLALVGISYGGSTNVRARVVAELSAERASRVESRRPDLAARAHAAVAKAHRVRFEAHELSVGEAYLRRAEANLDACLWPDANAIDQVLHARAMYARARGDNRAAADLTQQRLRLMEAEYGALDRRVLSVMVNAGMYLMRVDYPASIGIRRDLLARELSVWRDRESVRVAYAEKELAFALARSVDRGVLQEAHDLAVHALDVRKRHYGPRDYRTASARGVWIVVGCKVADALERESHRDGALLDELLAEAQYNMQTIPANAVPFSGIGRARNLAAVMVRRGEPAGVGGLAEVLTALGAESLDGELPLPGALERLDIEVLWCAAELVAAYCRFGMDERAAALAEAYGLVRIDDLPAFQPCGWRSTRPQDEAAAPM